MIVIGLDWESKGGGYTALQRQTEQVKWLDEVLTAHAGKTWKIITLHYEIPNTGFTPTSMATLGPVLDKHNVQLAFCGHGHSFRWVQVKNNVWTPSAYTRTGTPEEGAGTLHWQLGGMRPSDGNSQRWVLGEVDGDTIKFTVRNGSNEVVENECFTLTTVGESPEDVRNVDGNSNIKVYPNSFTESINISGAENCVLQVMDITGAKIYLQKISSNNEVVHLNKLTPGVYFFHIEKDKQVKIVKIIKR
jgi:hypothetical protein